MHSKKFTEAMSELDGKYIAETLSYTSNVNPVIRFRRRFPVVFVAALAAIFLMGAAGVVTIYHLVVGFNIEQTEERFSVDFSTGIAPAVIENDRLWFIADGQHIDITDSIDENTPYIYTTVNTTTNRTSYIIIGGTPDNFGYAEIWTNNGIVGFAARHGEVSMMMELTAQEFEQGMWEVPVESIDGLWLPNAIKQLLPEL